MTKEFYSDCSIVFRVEAYNKAEARFIIESLVSLVRDNLPTGVTISIGEHHQDRQIAVFNA